MNNTHKKKKTHIEAGKNEHDKPKRCPNGTRRNPKTGLCDPVKSKAPVIPIPSPTLSNPISSLSIKRPNIDPLTVIPTLLPIEPNEPIRMTLPVPPPPPEPVPHPASIKALEPEDIEDIEDIVQPTPPPTLKPEIQTKLKRCPKGTRRNRKTGICEPKDGKQKLSILTEEEVVSEIIPTPPPPLETPEAFLLPTTEEMSERQIDKKKRCPKGTRKSKVTNTCENIMQKYQKKKTPNIEEPHIETQNKEIPETEVDTGVEAVQVEMEPEVVPEVTPQVMDNTGLPFPVPLKENEILKKQEKQEHDQLEKDYTLPFLYPTLNDPHFHSKIANRKEFQDTKYDGTIHPVKSYSDNLCDEDFEFSPHQLFVKKFMSLQTPYNGLLLYHGVGTGKTCSAIGIAEEMRAYMKQVGIRKRILIVASPNVQSNFRLQLFDERKLKKTVPTSADEDAHWNIRSCVGNSLLNEINPTHLKGLPRKKVVSMIQSIIHSHYEFMGYGQLVNYISQKIKVGENVQYTDDRKNKIEIQNIKNAFNHRLIIIDEVHNIRLTDENNNKNAAILLMKVAKHADHMRLLLLSATPLYNSYKEIVWISNLLNINDKRSTIDVSDVFDKNGNFREKEEKNGVVVRESGYDLLRRKLTGYISYVRGENPYTFPYRIYPDLFAPEKTFASETGTGGVQAYPTIQMNKKTIDSPLKHVKVYLNTIHDYQEEAYRMMLDNLRNKSKVNRSHVAIEDGETVGEEGAGMPTFENMESFGYTLLQAPLELLNIVYPNEELDELLRATSQGSVGSPGSEIQDTKQVSNVLSESIGMRGLSKIIRYKEDKSIPMRSQFEYLTESMEAYGPIFHRDHLPKYSSKIHQICQSIRQSTGIVLIYSQYIDGGIIPMCLALEEMGFSRYCSTEAFHQNLFKTRRTENIDAIHMKPRGEMVDHPSAFQPAKYMIITGDKSISPSNAEDVKYATDAANMYGEKVKVILISKAGSEGLDFKNIRQVHILEPWYNMNRIEQIVGRAVRYKSHCEKNTNAPAGKERLPFEERNVEIYMHSSVLENSQEETADLYIYRLAEKKALQIGKVTRLLKQISVDCILNIGQTNFTVDKLYALAENQHIQLRLSSGTMIDYRIGDQPFTDICDYMDTCEYKCIPATRYGEGDVQSSSYRLEHMLMNREPLIRRVKNLFLEKNFYKRETLIQSINAVRQYPIEEIYFVLTYLIRNKNEFLTDKLGRTGRLVNKGEYYAFQPMEITDEQITLYERNTPLEYRRESIVLELPHEVSKEYYKELQEIKKKMEKEKYGEKTIILLEKIKEAEQLLRMRLTEEEQKEITDEVNRKVSQPKGVVVPQIVKEPEKEAVQEREPQKEEHEHEPLLESIRSQYQLVFGPRVQIATAEKDWFKHMNHTVEHLMTVYQVPKSSIEKYVVYKCLDHMEWENKIILLNHMYSANGEIHPRFSLTYPVHSYIKQYFDRLLLRQDSRVGFVLGKEGGWKVLVPDVDMEEEDNMEEEETTHWVEGQPEDYKIFGRELDRFDVEDSSIHEIIGFIALFHGREMVFKLKDIRLKRNNIGARCDQKRKGDVVQILNTFLGKEVYDPKVKMVSYSLCCIIEILMRYYTDIQKDGKVYFFPPEESAINDILRFTV